VLAALRPCGSHVVASREFHLCSLWGAIVRQIATLPRASSSGDGSDAPSHRDYGCGEGAGAGVGAGVGDGTGVGDGAGAGFGVGPGLGCGFGAGLGAGDGPGVCEGKASSAEANLGSIR